MVTNHHRLLCSALNLSVLLIFAGCKMESITKTIKSATGSSESDETASTGQINLQQESINAVSNALTKSETEGGGGMTLEEVAPITAGGLALPQTTALFLASNYNPSDLTQATPVVAKQAIAALSDSATGLTDVNRKIKIAALINTTIIKYIGTRITGVTDQTLKKGLPGAITGAGIGALNEAGIPTQNLASAMSQIAAGAVANFDEAGYTDQTELKEVFKLFTTASLGAFDDAGLSGISQFGMIADDFMKGAVGALDESGLSGAASYQTFLGPIVEGAMSGLKNAGVTGDSLINLYDSVMTGSIGGLANLGDIKGTDVPGLAAALNGEAIAYLDDLGMATATQMKTASQVIASGTMKAMGSFDTSFMSKTDVQASAQQISEKAMDALYEHQKNLFTEDVFGDMGQNFSEGLTKGLADAGWKRSEVNGATSYIKSGLDAALADEANINATTIWNSHVSAGASVTLAEARIWCEADNGSWNATDERCDHPVPVEEIPAGVSIQYPTPEEHQNCQTAGGIIVWMPSGSWFCDNEGTIDSAPEQSSAFCDYGEAVCKDIVECEWNGSNCNAKSTGCEIRFDKPSCTAETGCTWDLGLHICRPSSLANSSQTDWCSLYTESTTCALYSQCTWDGTICKVQEPSTFNGDPTACGVAGFFYSTGICIYPPMCTDSVLDTAESLCVAASCQWNGSTCDAP